jgi:DNA repair protein RadC
MAMVIADIPMHERPRERLLRCGLEALTERELLAAAKTVGLRFLDHVIVAGDEWRSVTTSDLQMPC